MKRAHFIDVAVCVLVIILTCLLYRKVVRLWWTWDDAYLIHIAALHSARDHFFRSAIWLSMPQQLFTPILTAAYDTELTLLGADPRRFYLVHLAELSLTAAALYATLRFWMSRAAASCAAIVFTSGATLCTMATQLMLMHYILSVLLGVVSVALFTMALRSRQNLIGILSAIVYLTAMLAKEIAIPLPAVMLILPESDLKTRLRRSLPHATALLLYIIWRFLILGKFVGGYATYTFREFVAVAMRTPLSLLGTFAGPARTLGVSLLVVLAIGIVVRLRSVCDAIVVILAFILA